MESLLPPEVPGEMGGRLSPVAANVVRLRFGRKVWSEGLMVREVTVSRSVGWNIECPGRATVPSRRERRSAAIWSEGLVGRFSRKV